MNETMTRPSHCTHGAAAPATVQLRAQDVNSWGGVYCPNPQSAASVASNHPRVNVDLTGGSGKCPYCGTVYQLPAGHALASGH